MTRLTQKNLPASRWKPHMKSGAPNESLSTWISELMPRQKDLALTYYAGVQAALQTQVYQLHTCLHHPKLRSPGICRGTMQPSVSSRGSKHKLTSPRYHGMTAYLYSRTAWHHHGY